MPELDPSHTRLLGALTVAAVKHLADDTAVLDSDGQMRTWRIARIGDDITLVDHPADDDGPRFINCYATEVERFEAIDGLKFKIDPQKMIFSLRWLHKGEPPDLDLALVREMPERWISAANLTLLAALRHSAPHAINWSGMGADVVRMIDAFEAHRESKTAPRH